MRLSLPARSANCLSSSRSILKPCLSAGTASFSSCQTRFHRRIPFRSCRWSRGAKMAACTRCSGAAVFSPPLLCERHFFSLVEGKVSAALQRFSLIRDGERVAVAVSGGKDSQTTLFLLHRLFGERATGIAIDEGIPHYRDQTLADLRHFCMQYGILFRVLSFREAFGVELEGLLARGASACRSCGVLRRSLLNQGAAGFDKLATGHNLDDECQSALMNFLK